MEEIRRPDAATLFTRALRSEATTAGHAIDVTEIASRCWSSATFTGDQILLRIVVASPTQDGIPGILSWLSTLPEAAFCLRGHIVADLAIDSSVVIGAEVHATIAVLTLIDV